MSRCLSVSTALLIYCSPALVKRLRQRRSRFTWGDCPNFEPAAVEQYVHIFLQPLDLHLLSIPCVLSRLCQSGYRLTQWSRQATLSEACEGRRPACGKDRVHLHRKR